MEAIIQIIQAKQDKKYANYLCTSGEVFLVVLDLGNYLNFPFRYTQFEIFPWSKTKETKRQVILRILQFVKQINFYKLQWQILF